MDFTNIGLSLLITSLFILLVASIMHAAKKLAGSAQKPAEKPIEEIFHVPSGRAEYCDLFGRTVRYRKSRKALRRGAEKFGKAVLVGSCWRYRDGKLRLVAKLRNEVGTVFTRFDFEVA